MPYWFEKEKLRLPEDKRYKLTKEDKLFIKSLYYKEGWSIRKIARLGICSRRMVQFILFPERYQRALELRKINGRLNNNYRTREKNRIWIKRYRDKKKAIFGLKRRRNDRNSFNNSGRGCSLLGVE